MKIPSLVDFISMIRYNGVIMEVKLLISFLIVIVYNPLVLLPVDIPSSVYVDIAAAIILVVLSYLIPAPGLNEVKVPEFKGEIIEIGPEEAKQVNDIIITSTSIMGVKERGK